MRRRRAALSLAIGLAVVGVVLVGTLLVLTNTDWGRDRVRRVTLDRIARAIDGEIEIGRIEGNLLRRVRLIDVTIRDRQGRPFMEADTLETRFGLRALLRQRLELVDVRVVGADVLLDKPPGEEWNYVRIFGGGAAAERRPSGWGDWVALDDVTLVDSRVTVRTEWTPPDDLTPAEREAAVRHALAGDTREHIVEVPGGYQNVMQFGDLDAALPRILVAHPDTAGMALDVASFSGLVRPFSPPPARVRDLSGEFRLVGDTLLMSGIQAVLPGSRLSGGGVYALHSGDLLMIARGHPVAFEDLRWLYPPLPEQGGGSMMMTLELGSIVNRIVLRELDVAVGEATVAGRLDLTTGDTLRIGDTDLRFARVGTGLVERFIDFDSPRPGFLSGRVAVTGVPRALRVDGDVRFDDVAGASSRVLAEGGLSVEPEAGFRELRLQFRPLDATLARAVVPDLPLAGTIEGTAVLTGSLTSLDLEADLALRDPRHGLSQVRLTGGVDRGEELRLRDMVVRMDPLRLDLLRDAFPELPTGAAATGRVALDGVPSRALRLDGDIVLDDPATGISGIGATGEIRFEDEVRFRDLRLRFSPLQAELARALLPELPLSGSIEGTAVVTGSPTDLDLEADLTLRDPRHGLSRVELAGGVDRRAELRLREMVVQMDPLRLDLLRDEVPELPAGAVATGRVVLDGAPSRALRVDGEIALDDPATGVSQIAATGRVGLGEELRFDDLRVRVDPLRVDLVRPWLPDLPPGGSLVGAVSLDGTPSRFLMVDGQLAHRHPELGESRVRGGGGISLAGPLVFHDLDLRLEPLHMALVRAFAPELPLDGTLAGTLTLNGSPASRIMARGDIVHVEGGERSHVVGTADVATGPGGRAMVDVRLQPLSLDVAGRFVPAAGLHGAVTGRLQASGDLADLRLDADLRAADGGVIRAEGTLDLETGEPAYDLDVELRRFDLAAVTWRAPASTDLSGTVAARGHGLDPATMDATIAADLADSGIDDARADRVRLRLALDAGLARFDSSTIRLGSADALLDGSFGLVAGREGVLDYRVAIDSLHAFATWLPGADSGVAPVRRPPPAAPAPVVDLAGRERGAGIDADEPLDAAADAAAAEVASDGEARIRRYLARDGARVTETTTRVRSMVEHVEQESPSAATPQVAPAELDPALNVDDDLDSVDPGHSLAAASPAIPLATPSDSLAGSLHAAGTARGNVTRFDLDGRATVDELVYLGSHVGGGEIEYALADLGTVMPDIRLVADLRGVRTAAAAFDSVSARARYHTGGGAGAGVGVGEAVIVAHGEETEYRADAAFTFSPARSELRVANLMLRFDTVTWQMTQPGVVSWAGEAVEVARIELASDAGGRMRLDGRLPVDGSGDMAVAVEDLEIAQLAGLLQLDEDAAGRLNLDADVGGTLAAPRIIGTLSLDGARLRGEDVPDVRASFRYEGAELTGDAVLLHEGRTLATAEGRLPIDLSLVPDVMPRLLPGEMAVDVTADSLPVEAIPALSEHLQDARGRLRGQLAVRGTVADPRVTGEVELDLASVHVVPLNVRLEEVAGSLVLEDDVVRVDSLVAWSGGPIRISGEIGIGTWTDPAFGLDVVTRETLVIDTEDITLALDADLAIGGTLAVLEVEGDIRTRRGVIHVPTLAELGETEVVSLHAPGRSERLEPAFLRQLRLPELESPLLDRMRLDVAVRIERDVWLRSLEANVEIYTPREVGPLRVRIGQGGRGFALEGTLNTDRGEFEFMSHRFDLTRGAATFIAEPEINPILQIAAEHEVRLPGREAFDLRVLLGGTLRDPEITLESNAQPPIAQTDLLAYLAFGRGAATLLYQQGSPLSAQAGDAGELAGNVAGLATQQLGTIALDAVLTDLEHELMGDLHVDVFRITPADLPPDMFTGRYIDLLRSTEVEAGRYLNSRLFVAGQLNTGVTRPGIRVEYLAPFGLQWLTSWRSRWLPTEPTLTELEPRRTGVLGSFLLREWRY